MTDATPRPLAQSGTPRSRWAYLAGKWGDAVPRTDRLERLASSLGLTGTEVMPYECLKTSK
jgi:hypothetical protein